MLLAFASISYKPFPNCSKSLFQSEAKCEAVDMKMILFCHANETHYHRKDSAPSLVLKERVLELEIGLLVWSKITHISTDGRL